MQGIVNTLPDIARCPSLPMSGKKAGKTQAMAALLLPNQGMDFFLIA